MNMPIAEIRKCNKHELEEQACVENTRPRKVFIPRTDIYETKDNIVVLADMPGVDENSVDIMLEKNTLTIKGLVNPSTSEGYSLTHAEYSLGDYQRSFTLSNLVDREGILATVKNGTLKLVLPKHQQAKSLKIEVKAG